MSSPSDAAQTAAPRPAGPGPDHDEIAHAPRRVRVVQAQVGGQRPGRGSGKDAVGVITTGTSALGGPDGSGQRLAGGIVDVDPGVRHLLASEPVAQAQ